MNSSNLKSGIRSPRFHRRVLTDLNRNVGTVASPQDAVINPMGQHRYQYQQHPMGVVTVNSHAPPTSYLSSPTTLRKILPNDFNVAAPLSSAINIQHSSNSSSARITSEHHPNLSVWVPLRTAGGSSSSASNNYYQQQQTTTTNAAIRSSPSPLLQHQREGHRYNNIQRNLDVDRESVDTGIATQLCHPPFHLEQRAVYVWHPQKSMGIAAATDGLYQMKPVIKSRKVIGILDVAQLINDARCCSPATLHSPNDNIQLPLQL